MTAFLMDILLQTIVLSLLIDFGCVHSSELTAETSRYRPLPPSTTTNARRKPKFESPLIKYQAQEDTGYYKFGYAVADGQYRVEEGSPQDGILGSYGYIGTDGKDVKVFYKADSQGFQILTADVYKFLSEAKKRSQHGSTKPNSAPPSQDDFYHYNQKPAKNIEDVVEVFSGNKHEFYPTPENNLETKPVPESPEIEPYDIQQPSFTFAQNMFTDRFPSSVPIFFPPAINSHFVNNQIPTYYYPKIHYENPFIKRKYRLISPEIHHGTPLIIRV